MILASLGVVSLVEAVLWEILPRELLEHLSAFFLPLEKTNVKMDTKKSGRNARVNYVDGYIGNRPVDGFNYQLAPI